MKYAKQTFITLPNRYTLATVSTNAQAVYIWLCQMQDAAGRCWPTVDTLAELTHTSRSSVKRACTELEQAGLISRSLSFREGVGQQANLYEVLICDTEPVVEADTPPVQSELPPRSVNRAQSTVNRPPVQKQPTPPVHTEPQTKPSILTKTIELKPNTRANKSPGKSDPIAAAYYRVIKQLNLPTVNNNNVRAAIAKLKKETSETDALKYLEFMETRYLTLDWPYKPQVSEALHIYSKRVAIINSIKQAQKEQDHARAKFVTIN